VLAQLETTEKLLIFEDKSDPLPLTPYQPKTNPENIKTTSRLTFDKRNWPWQLP